MGLFALRHVGSSRTRARTRVPCTGRRILSLCATREALAWAPGGRAPAVVAHGLQSAGSAAVAHGLSRSAARGILPDQGSNPCPLHWQADS
ncbi:hypothetical protein J1605_009538 [Eschrichtius robustus]|uniref:Uncharacterized protein n=1 Tax=Eschrichtius robustus TaxID=9764 RepID=A0AB34GWB8_ESCRO|nr:hypothetical protein J1605_009538 [Eschrichtius robustus]